MSEDGIKLLRGFLEGIINDSDDPELVDSLARDGLDLLDGWCAPKYHVTAPRVIDRDSVPCACKHTCGDVDEDDDVEYAVCKGLERFRWLT